MEGNDDIFMLRYAHRLPSVKVLFVSNLGAAAFIFFFGGIRELAGVYCWEMLIIWIFSFIKLGVVSPLYTLSIGLLLLAPAGVFFMAVFVLMVGAAGRWESVSPEFILNPFVIVSALPLLYSHAYSFRRNFWPARESYRGKNESRSLNKFAGYPYKRVFGWGAALLFSFIVSQILAAPWFAYVLIFFFKTAADVWSHVSMNDLKLAAAANSGS